MVWSVVSSELQWDADKADALMALNNVTHGSTTGKPASGQRVNFASITGHTPEVLSSMIRLTRASKNAAMERLHECPF